MGTCVAGAILIQDGRHAPGDVADRGAAVKDIEAFAAGGHYPHVNRPDAYNELLRGILLEQASTSGS